MVAPPFYNTYYKINTIYIIFFSYRIKRRKETRISQIKTKMSLKVRKERQMVTNLAAKMEIRIIR